VIITPFEPDFFLDKNSDQTISYSDDHLFLTSKSNEIEIDVNNKPNIVGEIISKKFFIEFVDFKSIDQLPVKILLENIDCYDQFDGVTYAEFKMNEDKCQ
jgi:hypothetical protein